MQPASTVADPTGPWAEHPERSSVLKAHTDILWSLLSAYGAASRADPILHRELCRMVKESLWAAAETKVADKYDLRYVSADIFKECHQRGPLTSWVNKAKTSRAAVNLEHVRTQSELRERLFEAQSREQLEAILLSVEACVVSVQEHERLGEATEAGWARYAEVGIAVWDRAAHAWRKDCGRAPDS